MTVIAKSTRTALAATDNVFAARLADARSIGTATDNLAARYGAHAAAIVANVPDGYDWTARGAVPQAVHLFVCGEVKGSAVPDQKRADKTATPYGTYVDGVKSHVAALVKGEPDSPAVAMRVSLTGVGSAVVPADHPAYALLLALLGAESDDDAADAADAA